MQLPATFVLEYRTRFLYDGGMYSMRTSSFHWLATRQLRTAKQVAGSMIKMQGAYSVGKLGKAVTISVLLN